MQKPTFKNKKHLRKQAFTLIELLIVIAIIGILFIVLVSKVNFATDKAKTTGVQTDFRSFQVAIESVSKENAGLATFGWDTGDTNGNRIRDSYDKGDINQNGNQDSGEIFVGSKTYGETWTNVYTLTNPADANDKSAIAALEEAINKNLDPKLHITIADDLTITMANGAQDPWNKEYHGEYITNAEVDKKDRGAIIIYSDGVNNEFGSEHTIANGIVSVSVPGNNVKGKDDYSMAVVYTYVNGYGEVQTSTSGFSNNQTTQGNVSNNSGTEDTEELLQLPSENPSALTLDVYSWSEIKALARAKLTASEYKSKYGIEPGYTKTVDGVEYVLVDLGLDVGDYDGFVFMYNSKIRAKKMNASSTNVGGYAASDLAPQVESLYTNLSNDELKTVIKEVSIICNDGYDNYEATHTYKAHMFLASYIEVGFTNDLNDEYCENYKNEGQKFDLFLEGTDTNACNMRKKIYQSDVSWTGWWLRSAVSDTTYGFNGVTAAGGGSLCNSISTNETLVPVFVVG